MSKSSSRKWMLGLAVGLMSLTVQAPMTAQEEREEVFERRDVFTKVFDNHDGSKTWHSGLEALHYRPTGEEVFLDIDPTLVQEGGWTNETNAVPSRLPEMLGDGAALELGPELGIHWRPGMLFARLTSGEEIELGVASPSWGVLADELENAVVYPDLYPGLDLMVEVRRGSLKLVTLFREWLFDLEPEQIDFLFIEAQLEPDASLMEAVETRIWNGEPVEEVPLYFGRADDEYALGLFGHPGITDSQLSEYSDSLYREEEGENPPGPDGWRSNTTEFLSSGTIRHYFHHPENDPIAYNSGISSSSAAALTASFKISWNSELEKKRYFSSTYQPTLFDSKDESTWESIVFKCEFSDDPWGCKKIGNYIVAAKSVAHSYRTYLNFKDLKPLRKDLLADKTLEVVGMEIGRGVSTFLPPGTTAVSTDEIIAYSALPFMEFEAKSWSFTLDSIPTEFPVPYNEEARSVPGGNIKTSSWSSHSQQSSTRSVNGSDFHFGPLFNGATSTKPSTALNDLRTFIIQRNMPMPIIIATPYDSTPCSHCTANHPNPAVQALNGDYRVGAGLYDLRLEITTRNKNAVRQATLTATSVGNHNDQLYPGETKAWDIELSSYSGPSDVVELNAVQWRSANGVDFWFTDPASGNTVYNPPLPSVGSKVRVHAKWDIADSSLYGKTKKLELFGWFRNAKTSAGGSVEIPIHLKAPTAQVAFNQIYPVFDDNVTAATGLAWIQLPTSGLRATTYATAALDWVSGPTKKLQQGSHWDIWKTALPNSDGEVVIYPSQFQPGSYSVDLTPCLWPAGQGSTLHCVSGQKQRLSFDVRAASPANYPPAIDFISPWSLESPSGGPVIVAIQGLNLGGTVPTTKVKIPQLLSLTTPQAGSTNQRVSVRVQTASNQICGPRELSIITAAGTDTALFNVTKPFSTGNNLFAVEAEAGVVSNLAVQSFAGASNGKAIGRASAGSNGKLTLFFQVPTTANYQIHALYGVPEQKGGRGEVAVFEDNPTTGTRTLIKKFTHGLPTTPKGQFRNRPIRDINQVGGATRFSLESGKYYRLELSSIQGQAFPFYDLLAFSDGSFGPKTAELCQ